MTLIMITGGLAVAGLAAWAIVTILARYAPNSFGLGAGTVTINVLDDHDDEHEGLAMRSNDPLGSARFTELREPHADEFRSALDVHDDQGTETTQPAPLQYDFGREAA